MVRTRADHLILWPSYFDASKSRAEGRRVSKSLAIPNPTSGEILAAAQAIGLKATLHEDKCFPRFWWEYGGCVSVEKSLAKTELIGKVATRMKSARPQS